METVDAAEERLRDLLHRLDFARRWFELCVAARVGTPSDDLPAAEQAAALASTGRIFQYNRRERFYATREAGVPGELGINLSLRHGVAEFILVVRVLAGHIGGPFSRLMREVAQRYGPALPEEPRCPQPWYQGPAELRQVLVAGCGLYAEVAGAVLASGLLTGSPPDAVPSAAADRRGM